jgi:Kdo2-lipid IVA lauroyltransferase/acyltransferase
VNSALPERKEGPRDARSGEVWTPFQRLKNALIYLLIRCLLEIVDRIPQRLLLATTRWLGGSAHRLLRQRRRIAESNLALACPGEDAQRTARLSFCNAGENLGRILLLRRKTFRVKDYVSMSGQAARVLECALAEQRGVVFVSAHLGPFEWLAAFVAELGLRPAIVVRESYDPRLNAIVDRHRVERGIEVIHRGDAQAWVRILRALRAGRPVGFLPDLGGRVPARPVRWLGRVHRFPMGPQRLALRVGAPLLVGTLSAADDGRFGVWVERLENPQEETMTRSVANALERAICGSKEHWLWMAHALGEAVGEQTTPAAETNSLRDLHSAR